MTGLPLRILIVGLNYAPEPTGIAPYTSSLAAGLKRRGNSVRVITGHPHYPEWRVKEGYGQWTRHDAIEGVRVTRLKSYVPRKTGVVRRALSEVSFGLRAILIRWGRPDIVVVVSPALLSSAIVAARVSLMGGRVPLAVWVQDLYSSGVAETGSGGAAAVAVVSQIESRLLQSASGMAAIHDRFRMQIEEKLHVSASRIEVIRNWSHLKPTPAVSREAVRARWGWSGDETIVLHAGNMGAKQGLENVLEAARLADGLGANIRFVLLGDGNQRDRLVVEGAGIKRLQFIDPLPDKDFQAALGSADILLVNELAGLNEMAVPSKLTSYYSTGLPVLAATATDSVTAFEIKTSGGGVQVDPGDPMALVQEALELGRDRVRAERLGASGKAFRATHLSETEGHRQFAEWLGGLVKDRKRR